MEQVEQVETEMVLCAVCFSSVRAALSILLA
jgi:hypothetical protein